MTDAEKIIRDKAVWLVVGGIEEIMSHRIPASLMGRGRGVKFLAAIMPIEEERKGQ